MSWLKGTGFMDFISVVKNKPNAFFMTPIFDVLFIIGFFLINAVLNPLANMVMKFQSSPLQKFQMVMVSLIGIALLSLAYSLCKNLLLNRLGALFTDRRMGLLQFFKFFKLNVGMLVSLGVSYLLFTMVFSFIVPPDESAAFSIFYVFIFIILAFFMYVLWNSIHSIFFQHAEKPIRWIVRNGFDSVFADSKKIFRIFGTDILVFVIYLIIFMIFGIFMKISMMSDASRLEAFNPIYVRIFSTASFLVIYLLFSYNRYSFLGIAQSKSGKKL